MRPRTWRSRGAGLAWVTALAAATALIGGCQLTTVEVAVPDDVVVVEAFLRSDADYQRIYLYRTLAGEEATERVDDAVVRVLGEEGAPLLFTLTDTEEACAQSAEGSCYRSQESAAFIRPGGTYRLEVTLADGAVLTGVTHMPGEFQVVTPADPACELGDGQSLPIVWTTSEGAWSYQVVATFLDLAPGLKERGVVDPPNELQLIGLAIGGADTTIVFPGEFGVFDRFSVDRDLLLALAEGLPIGSRADIVLAAGDRNYVNWVRGGNFNPSGQVRVPSVTGEAGRGTGVFGSLSVRRRTLVAEDHGVRLPSCHDTN